jgi:hypothetical protein
MYDKLEYVRQEWPRIVGLQVAMLFIAVMPAFVLAGLRAACSFVVGAFLVVAVEAVIFLLWNALHRWRHRGE